MDCSLSTNLWVQWEQFCFTASKAATWEGGWLLYIIYIAKMRKILMIKMPLCEICKYVRMPSNLCTLLHWCTWRRRAGGRMNRWGGTQSDCNGPESVGAGLQSDAGRRWDGPDSPCCPLSCIDRDSSSGTSQSQSHWTGPWWRH